MMTREELLDELRRSRLAILRDVKAVRAECNIPAKAKLAFRQHPTLWLGSAAAIGWMLAAKKRRKTRSKNKKVPKNSPTPPATPVTFWGVLLAILKWMAPLLKPVLTAYAARHLAALGERFAK